MSGLTRREWLRDAGLILPLLSPSSYFLVGWERLKSTGASGQQTLTGGIGLNEDSSHFFVTRAGKNLTPELVDALVDQYANTTVNRIYFNPNAMRTSYASEVWDPIWKGYSPNGPDDQPLFASTTDVASRKNARNWVHTAWSLYDMAIDPYTRWINRCRNWGISPWISMRMNDGHYTDDVRSYIHSDFWRQNPQFWLPPTNVFDFGYPEVRQYTMLLVKELVARYDFDGLELDWMRFPYYFQPGKEAEGAVQLTQFIWEVRQNLNEWGARRGHPIQLSVRVPSRPQSALGIGLDAVTWAKQALIDQLVITPFWFTIEFDMPIAEWKRLIGSSNIKLAAGLELNLQPYPNSPFKTNTLHTVRAAAASLLDLGADGIYLFNFMDSQAALPDIQNYQEMLMEVGSLATLDRKPRRHILTFPDIWAPGETPYYPLPSVCVPGQPIIFRLPTGPVSTYRRVLLRLGVAGGSSDKVSGWQVQINGYSCIFVGIANPGEPQSDSVMFEFSVPSYAISGGYNFVTVYPGLPSFAGVVVQIEWVEISFES